MESTIVGLSTPYGNGAIHIIRLSGEQTYKLVSKIANKQIKKNGYSIERANIFDNGKKIDDVLLMKFVKPKSFTGEDMIEINCHGGLYVAQKIISLLMDNGCSLAKNGEFSKRAFINGKISLLEANGINNLINSSNDIAINHAITGIDKTTAIKINEIRKELFNLIAKVEINIDYPEYKDQPEISNKIFFNEIIKINNQLKNIYISSKKILSIKDGINIAIIGKPNVGKSSLLNTLIKQNKAIVSSTPGTTRDIVESSIFFDSYKINFIDTAGIRNSKSKLENLGIVKAKNQIKKADLVVLVMDASKKQDNIDNKLNGLTIKKDRIVVFNKCDLLKKTKNKNEIYISAKNKKIIPLLDEIRKWLLKKFKFDNSSSYLQTSSELSIVKKSIENLSKLISKKTISIDLAINDVKIVYDQLGLIIGDGADVSFIDKMFSNFCLGK